jgi:hypothetical protein
MFLVLMLESRRVGGYRDWLAVNLLGWDSVLWSSNWRSGTEHNLRSNEKS